MNVKDIDVKQINLGENIRQIVKDNNLFALMQTIRDNGLLQPIGVKEVSDNKYQILWGNRRLSACKKLGWRKIPAVIFSDKSEEMTEEEFIVINGIENLQQSPNTLYEIGRVCKILRKTMSVSEIAVRLGISRQRVDMALTEIGRIPVKWQKKVKIMETGKEEKQGYIPVTHAVRVVQMRGLSSENRDKLLEHISRNDVSSDKVIAIGSLIQSGSSLKDAVKEAEGYETSSITVFLNKKLLDNVMKRYDSKIDLFVDCINAKYPKLAVKKL